MDNKIYKMNVFAKTEKGGNPAAVVLDADYLSEKEMKSIAKLIGFSETAFIMKSELADYKVRFFTPSEEVDLCGHATIAVFNLLFQKGYIGIGNYTQETKAGILNVEIMKNSIIMMNQSKPKFEEIIERDDVVKSLNISFNDIIEDLPIQIVSTGLRDIIVPVKNIEILNSIKPNFEKISNISRKYNAIGYHIFTLDTIGKSVANCRNLAPLYGINEESATGTANGALASYLFKYNKISNNIKKLSFEQGYSMNMPSEIIVSLNIKDNEIDQVKVGGNALNLVEMKIF